MPAVVCPGLGVSNKANLAFFLGKLDNFVDVLTDITVSGGFGAISTASSKGCTCRDKPRAETESLEDSAAGQSIGHLGILSSPD